MASIRTYRDLLIWQRSKELCKSVYRTTQKMPTSETYGLTIHIRRAAVSIPSNIAEGYNRKTRPEYIRALRIASGSLAELSTQMQIAEELGMVKAHPEITQEMEELDRMINALIRKLLPAK
ncbi:MAG: four helix bundle protein [Phycisphaerales bacterium]